MRSAGELPRNHMAGIIREQYSHVLFQRMAAAYSSAIQSTVAGLKLVSSLSPLAHTG